MKCEHCGAMLAPSALQCSYCRTATPAAQRARQHAEQHERAQAQWTAQQRAQQNAFAQAGLHRTASHALYWSLGGMLCCVPLSIVALVQALQARTTARALGTPVPVQAQIGLGLSVFGMVLSVGGLVWAIVASQAEERVAAQRIAVLEAQTITSATAATLSQPTACALAEARVLATGYDGHPGGSLETFECVGKLVAGEEQAALDTFRFRWNRTRYETHVCLRRGARWYVTDVGTAPCAP